jgi:hypothetical protein
VSELTTVLEEVMIGLGPMLIGVLPVMAGVFAVTFGFKAFRTLTDYSPVYTREERRKLEAESNEKIHKALVAMTAPKGPATLEPPKNEVHVEQRCKCAYCDPDRYAVRSVGLEPPKTQRAHAWRKYWDGIIEERR